MSIGDSIRQLRKEKGMTQTELAEKLNITQSMLCQIERGTKTPSLPLGKEIADALGCELGSLVAKRGKE